MKVEIITTSDRLTKDFAEEVFTEIKETEKIANYVLSVNDNFVNEIFNSGVLFIIYLGGVFAEKIVEKIVDSIVEKTKEKIKEKEMYDMNVTINIHFDNSKQIKQYNILTDIESLKKDLLDEQREKKA